MWLIHVSSKNNNVCQFLNNHPRPRCEHSDAQNCRQELRAYLLQKYPSVNIHPVRHSWRLRHIWKTERFYMPCGQPKII